MPTNPMTRLSDQLEAAMKAGTQGEWYTLDPPWLPHGCETSILAGSNDPHVARFICDFDMWQFDDEGDADKKSTNPDADAEFIVLCRNNAATIIAALRERGE